MKDFDLERELNKLEITPYKLSKETNIPYTSISELITKKRKFENVKLKQALEILFYIYSDEKKIFEVLKNISK